MIDTGILPALFDALFHPDLEGDIVLSAGDVTAPVTDRPSIEAFWTEHGEATALRLSTTGGGGSATAYWSDEAPVDLPAPCFVLFEAGSADSILIFTHETIADYAAITAGSAALAAIPLPGAGSWSLSTESVARLTDGVIQDDMPAPAAEKPADAPVSDDAVMALNDAIFPSGAPAPHVLDLPISLGMGRSRDEKRWVARGIKFGDLMVLLSKHTPGEKDGKAFLQGNAAGNTRKAPAMMSMYIVGLDIDSGIDLQWAVDRITELKLCSIIYTTHSHQKPQTLVSQTAYAKWAKKLGYEKTAPTNEEMRQFLVDVRGWEKPIAVSAEVDGKRQGVDGVSFVVNHVPMPKFRIVFPLSQAFTFIEQKGLMQQEAIDLWKGRLLGLAKIIGVPIDESCLDPSRLFYLPRHPKDATEYKVVVTAGDALDFDAVPNANPRLENAPDDDVFAAAARDLGASSAPLMFGDFSLKNWARTCAATFLPAEMIRNVAPERIRMDQNTGKIELECAFDHEHSNAGDAYDRASYCVDAHSAGTEQSFSWGCQHNSCRHRDRLEFVCEALKAGWFKVEDLQNDSFRCMTADMEEQQVALDPVMKTKELNQRCEALDKGDPDAVFEVEEIFKEAVRAKLPSFRTDILIQTIVKQGVQKKGTLNNMLKSLVMAQSLDVKDDDRAAEIVKNQKIKSCYGKDVVLIDENMGYIEQKDVLRERLINANKKLPTIFQYGGMLQCVRYDATSFNTRISALDWTRMADFLSNTIFLKQGENNAITIPLPERALKELAVSESWSAPMLESFSMLPYYRRDGTLITRTGYDPESRVYLKPAFDAKFNVPVTPTKQEIRDARDFILETVYADFPFDDGPEMMESGGVGSRAHFLCLIIQPFLRAMIQGPTPIFLVMKPTAGTGATLLIETALKINSGRNEIKAQTESPSEEEIRKNITSVFRSGDPTYWVDNVNKDLRSTSYCNLATASAWQDRLLGSSEMVDFPNRIQFILSGNNPKGSYEVMRRCLPIRLDARRDPRGRDPKTFKIEHLMPYVTDNRKLLIEAVLTLTNAWIAAGQPKWQGKGLLSFERWCEILGGVLDVAEVPGFMSNIHLSQKSADDESRAWESFLQFWLDNTGTGKCGGMGVVARVGQLASMIVDDMAADFPAIGIPARNDATQISVPLQKALDSKLNSPFSVYESRKSKTEVDERGYPVLEQFLIQVSINRGKVPGSGAVGYYLKKMEEVED